MARGSHPGSGHTWCRYPACNRRPSPCHQPAPGRARRHRLSTPGSRGRPRHALSNTPSLARRSTVRLGCRRACRPQTGSANALPARPSWRKPRPASRCRPRQRRPPPPWPPPGRRGPWLQQHCGAPPALRAGPPGPRACGSPGPVPHPGGATLTGSRGTGARPVHPPPALPAATPLALPPSTPAATLPALSPGVWARAVPRLVPSAGPPARVRAARCRAPLHSTGCCRRTMRGCRAAMARGC
mmetsp:Transcript_61185/g.197111  ORF Transcript_61185/g.197111 Transcript_61185/m.197111 type:complete len:242 (-) Transcript_61185:829-1554(-)